MTTLAIKKKPSLSFWQIFNMSFGFLGIQFGFALQTGNASRILQTFGAGSNPGAPLAPGSSSGPTKTVPGTCDRNSAALKRFVHETGLTPLPVVLGDWPSIAPAPLRLGTENVMTGPTLTAFDRQLGPPNGSDHQPIIFELAPAAGAGQPADE